MRTFLSRCCRKNDTFGDEKVTPDGGNSSKKGESPRVETPLVLSESKRDEREEKFEDNSVTKFADDLGTIVCMCMTVLERICVRCMRVNIISYVCNMLCINERGGDVVDECAYFTRKMTAYVCMCALHACQKWARPWVGSANFSTCASSRCA